jgi:hypothetical protein
MILFIYQAWERCTTKKLNFSGECLTSKKAQMALNNYLCTHPGLREEIEKRTGIIHGIEELDISMEEECPDDPDIPSRLIIQQALGITISETEGNMKIMFWQPDWMSQVVEWWLQQRRTCGRGIMAKDGAMSLLQFEMTTR